MDSRSDALVREDSERPPTHRPSPSAGSGPADTPQTQILPDRAGHLGEAGCDIGQRLGPDKLELFVATDAAHAMQEQIAHHAPEYIALHDLGGRSGLRLLAAIGAARGTPLQQLVIRRQGHGVALATLRFVALESRGGRRLRLYSTDVDADSQSRRQLARVLMSRARLGVMLVGELPGHALDTELAPWREALRAGPWVNREIIMVPLSKALKLGEHAARLASHRQVNVVVCTTAARPNEVWAQVAGAWNRIRDASRMAASARSAAAAKPATAMSSIGMPRSAPSHVTTTVPSIPNPTGVPKSQASPLIERMMLWAKAHDGHGEAGPASAETDPGGGHPEAPTSGKADSPRDAYLSSAEPPGAAPQAAASGAVDRPQDERWRTVMATSSELATVAGSNRGPAQRALYERYLRACEPIKGMMSACVFEARNGQVLAHAGGRPDPAPLAAQGRRLYEVLAESGHALGLGGSQPGATITLTQHHLLLHPLPGHPGIVMHAVLDGSIAEPTLAQLQLRLIDASVLDADGPG